MGFEPRLPKVLQCLYDSKIIWQWLCSQEKAVHDAVSVIVAMQFDNLINMTNAVLYKSKKPLAAVEFKLTLPKRLVFKTINHMATLLVL